MLPDAPPPVVLVADDSATVRLLVEVELEATGCTVLTAEDGSQALEIVRSHAVDVVLLDVEMPVMDGFATVTALQADAATCDVPVVFLTGRTGSDDAVRALELGALDYLRKPFEPAELRARVGVAVRVKRLQDSLREQAAEMDRLSRTDGLTGLHNRRHAEEVLLAHEHGSRRHDYPLAVLLVDIDHFKQVNDLQGHPGGDAVLRTVATTLADTVRREDLVGRWGGEEFVVVAPHTDAAAARALGERLRAAVAGSPAGVTISVGGAAALGPQADVLVPLADANLYTAKRAGRDRVQVSEPGAPRRVTPASPGSGRAESSQDERPNSVGGTVSAQPGTPRTIHALGEVDQ